MHLEYREALAKIRLPAQTVRVLFAACAATSGRCHGALPPESKRELEREAQRLVIVEGRIAQLEAKRLYIQRLKAGLFARNTHGLTA